MDMDEDPPSFPPSNPTPGYVSFRVEAWPHDSGANGEDYHAGSLSAAEVARVLRDIADRCEGEWSLPECPWPEKHGVEVKFTPPDMKAKEDAKRAAYERGEL